MNIKKLEGSIELVEFNSLYEFYTYIMNTQINDAFSNKELSSNRKNNYDFFMTHSFEEACDILKNGWTEASEKITNRLNVEGSFQNVNVSRNMVSVEGFHPIVPLYLNGIPTNMVTRKLQPVKQKVLNVNKLITYHAGVGAEKILSESIKALAIVKKLESQNYRCNLNVVLGTQAGFKKVVVRVRIKSANERLNINKMSFPLVHPSMLRRLYFRFIEVHPSITPPFVNGYGSVVETSVIRKVLPNDVILPQYIRKDIKNINTLGDLDNV